MGGREDIPPILDPDTSNRTLQQLCTNLGTSNASYEDQFISQDSQAYCNSGPQDQRPLPSVVSHHPTPCQDTPQPLMQTLVDPPSQLQAISLLQNLLSQMLLPSPFNQQVMQQVSYP